MILTIDYGTTNLKAALIDNKGRFYNYHSEEVFHTLDEKSSEVDSSIYLNFLINYLRKIDRSLISAIIISSNGPSFLSLYSEMEFENNKIKFDYSNTRLWIDKRGKEYSNIVSKYYNTYIDGSFFLPSILSIKNNEENNYNKTVSFITIDGFINYFLTKKIKVVNNADLLLKYYWDNDSLNYFDLDTTKFPSFIKCGETLGTIDNEIAEFLDLNNNIKIIAGGSDFYYSLIGSNINKENIIADINGTSEGVNLCINKFIKDSRFLCYEHPIQGYYNLSGVISNSGVAINWIKELLKIENYSTIYELAKNSKKNSIVFLPFLNGERAPIWNAEATATFFNLESNSSREDIAQAVIEGTIFSFKSVIEEFTKLGCKIEKIHTTTNKTNLEYYYQLKSDILNKEIVVYQKTSTELYGLAIMAYHQINNEINLSKTIDKFIVNSKTYYPNKKNTDYYNKKFTLYKKLYTATKDLMSKYTN